MPCNPCRGRLIRHEEPDISQLAVDTHGHSDFATAHPKLLAQMQQVLGHSAQRRGGAVPPELIGLVAPTRTEGINSRGVFRFQVERYAKKILPPTGAGKARAGAS